MKTLEEHQKDPIGMFKKWLFKPRAPSNSTSLNGKSAEMNPERIVSVDGSKKNEIKMVLSNNKRKNEEKEEEKSVKSADFGESIDELLKFKIVRIEIYDKYVSVEFTKCEQKTLIHYTPAIKEKRKYQDDNALILDEDKASSNFTKKRKFGQDVTNTAPIFEQNHKATAYKAQPPNNFNLNHQKTSSSSYAQSNYSERRKNTLHPYGRDTNKYYNSFKRIKRF
jgi:hypothetical protein